MASREGAETAGSMSNGEALMDALDTLDRVFNEISRSERSELLRAMVHADSDNDIEAGSEAAFGFECLMVARRLLEMSTDYTKVRIRMEGIEQHVCDLHSVGSA
jgi:hypothetical protein